MPRREPRRDHPNNHDVLFTDVRYDKCLMFCRRVSGDSWVPTDVAVFSLVLGVVRLSFVFGTHVRHILALFIGSIGLWRRRWILCSKSKGIDGLGRRRRGLSVPGRSGSTVSTHGAINVSPRQELAASNTSAVPVLTRRLP